ncbi:MAG: ABC transporter permease, partial [Cytophagia bacterium]|nr:ABC transporter permease [Cytophagia bacterium]
MNQIFLVLKREYLTRVKKKSFLLATILTPLVIPAIIFTIAYFATRDKDSRHDEIHVLDESGYFEGVFNVSGYDFTFVSGDLADQKAKFEDAGAFGLLYIPQLDLSDISVTSFTGFEFYSKTNPSFRTLESIDGAIERRIKDLKLQRSGLDADVVAGLQANVNLDTYNLTETGEAKESNSGLSYAVGYGMGFMIYMFIFVYGSQIMQSVLDEKTSR